MERLFTYSILHDTRGHFVLCICLFIFFYFTGVLWSTKCVSLMTAASSVIGGKFSAVEHSFMCKPSIQVPLQSVGRGAKIIIMI